MWYPSADLHIPLFCTHIFSDTMCFTSLLTYLNLAILINMEVLSLCVDRNHVWIDAFHDVLLVSRPSPPLLSLLGPKKYKSPALTFSEGSNTKTHTNFLLLTSPLLLLAIPVVVY